jgi:hypothetical protein
MAAGAAQDQWPGTPFQQPQNAVSMQQASPQQGAPFSGLSPALMQYVPRESGGKPFVGYTPPGKPLVDLSSAPLDDTGFPVWSGNRDPETGLMSHAAGILQFQPGTWRPIAKQLGIKDFSLESQVKVANELYKQQGLKPWQTWPGATVAAGNWKVDPAAIETEQDKKDTKVVWMQPDEYKQMAQKGDQPEDRPESKSLSKSLSGGDSVNTLPELTVRSKDGKYEVIDQDGWRRADAAERAGAQLIPVAIHGAAGDASEIIGMGGQIKPFDFKPVPVVPKAPTAAKEFGRGIVDVGAGLAQMGVRGVIDPPPIAYTEQQAQAVAPERQQEQAAAVDQSLQQRERQIEQERSAAGQTGTDWWRLAGNMAGSAPFMALGPEMGGGIRGAMAAGALGGAAGGAMAPVTQGDFATQKAKEIGIGGLLGAEIGAGGNVLGRMVNPAISPAARRLMEQGVRLTPGQMLGGAAKGAENRLTSIIPTAPGAIKRSIEDFNRVAYDKVLSRIGKAYEGKEVGYEGINAVEKELSKEYNRILTPLRFKVDERFAADLQNLRDLAAEMPPDEARQFEAIVKNRVIKRMGPEGAMDGQTFKAVESELSEISRRLSRSEVEGQRDLGRAVDEVNAMMRENLERQNPSASAALRKINGAWAGFVRLRDAATNRVKSLGIFTPADLLTAAKRSAGRRVFARGDALMQDLAKDAEEVLPNNLPDSGTVGRALMADALLSGGSALFAHPGVLATIGAGTVGYTGPGLKLLRAAAGAGLPAVRNLLARAAQGGARVLTPAAGIAASSPTPPPGF